MPLSEKQRTQVARALTLYCEHKVSAAIRDKLRLNFRMGRNDVVLFEERPRSDRPSDWVEDPVAKFVYVEKHREWRLYCQHRDLAWHEYQNLFASADFDELLIEVEDDPTGIFWG